MNVVALSLSCFMRVILFIDDACFMTQRLVFVFCGCKINKKVRKYNRENEMCIFSKRNVHFLCFFAVSQLVLNGLLNGF